MRRALHVFFQRIEIPRIPGEGGEQVRLTRGPLLTEGEHLVVGDPFVGRGEIWVGKAPPVGGAAYRIGALRQQTLSRHEFDQKRENHK